MLSGGLHSRLTFPRWIFALFEAFRLMLSDAVYTPGIPDTHVSAYSVTMQTNTNPERYTFYFAPTDGPAN